MKFLNLSVASAIGALVFTSVAPTEALSGSRDCSRHCAKRVHHHHVRKSPRLGLFSRHRTAHVRRAAPAPRVASYKTVRQRVMVQRARREFVRTPAEYGTRQVRVMKSLPRVRFERTPPVYKTMMRKVLVKRGTSRWVRTPDVTRTVHEKVRVGGGSRLTRCADHGGAHGSLKDGRGHRHVAHRSHRRGFLGMCRTHTPATYKTVARTVVVKRGGLERVGEPAHYEMRPVKVRVSGGRLNMVREPAVYGYETRRVVTKRAGFRVVEYPAVYETRTMKVRTGSRWHR